MHVRALTVHTLTSFIKDVFTVLQATTQRIRFPQGAFSALPLDHGLHLKPNEHTHKLCLFALCLSSNDVHIEQLAHWPT